MAAQTKPSIAWYLLPILFGIIGGVAMYLLLKDTNIQKKIGSQLSLGTDKAMAKKGLIVGIVITILWFAYSVVTSSLFWMTRMH